MNKETQEEFGKLLEEVSNSASAMHKVISKETPCECQDTDWATKAENNLEKWGEQDYGLLLLCMQEELGELTQVHLKGTTGDFDLWKLEEELSDLMALGLEMQRLITEEKKND